MDWFYIVVIIFFGLLILGVIITNIRTKGKVDQTQNIFDGLEPKTMINRQFLLKGTKFDKVYIMSIIFGPVIMFVSFILVFDYSEIDFPTVLPFILFYLCFISIPLFLLSKSNKYKNAIINDDYYIEEDILIKKFYSYTDNITNYYFKFQNQNKSILTTKIEYHKAEIGEKFYIIFAGNSRSAYNATLYQLEDESKIVKRVDEND